MMRRLYVLLFGLLFLFSMSGCFKGEQSMKTTNDVKEVDELTEIDQVGPEEKETDPKIDVTETVERQLFLIDANGMVAPQTLQLPNPDSKEVAMQVLTYLVKDGPVTSLLPNGFQAVLPEGTEILGVNLTDDGTLIVDLSDEFKNYDVKDELKILQAITYTLTQFDNINRIKIWINGVEQTEMPVGKTPIKDGYSRSNGINILSQKTVDLLNSDAVTMYFLKQRHDTQYFVPVTQHIEIKEKDYFTALIETLIAGPGYDTHIIHVFNEGVALQNKPRLENGVLQLTFNEEILKDAQQSIIADDVMETLVRSLTEQKDVQAIEVSVENKDKIINEKGKVYNKPVTKQFFELTKKM